MSDYFRFYEDSIDEPRLQYAIHKNPLVLCVWAWVLCECSRSKSDTIGPICNATLLGVSQKLNIGAGVVNECLRMLEDIHYIKTGRGGKLLVRKWNHLQSDYSRRIDSRRTVTGQLQTRNTGYMYCPVLSCKDKERGLKGELENDAEVIWKAYPRKVGKPVGIQKIRKAIIGGKNVGYVLERTLAYADAWSKVDKSDWGWIPHPSTWFHQERYNDDPVTWTRKHSEPKKHAKPYDLTDMY